MLVCCLLSGYWSYSPLHRSWPSPTQLARSAMSALLSPVLAARPTLP
jgi:hypothetical protein